VRTISRTQASAEITMGTSTPNAFLSTDSAFQFVQNVFSQMLVTFRFTSPTEVSSTPRPTGSVTPTLTSTPMPANMTGWSTYTNSIFGFSIAYPPTMKLENFMQVEDKGGFDWIPLCNYYEASNLSLVSCLYLPRGTYPDTSNTTFTGASLAISTTNLEEQDCLSYSDFRGMGIEPPKPTLINGISFSVLKTVGIGTGHVGMDVRNRNFAHHICLEITITMAGYTSSDYLLTNTPGATPTPYPNYQNVQTLLNEVLSTFHFTDSQSSTANP